MRMALAVIVALVSFAVWPEGAEAGGSGGRFRAGGSHGRFHGSVRRDFHGLGARKHSNFHGLPRKHFFPGHGHGRFGHVDKHFPHHDKHFDHGRKHHQHGHKHFHGTGIFVVPGTVFVAPSRCWTPGYWSYQWVPVASSYTVWVPGHWAPDGRWVEGHYAQQPYTTGSYQPYWVEGYWRDC